VSRTPRPQNSPFALGLALALALPLAAVAAPAHAGMLADSTVTDAWRLPNGLEVRTRQVPGAVGVAVTLAFRAGSGYEPAGREGSPTSSPNSSSRLRPAASPSARAAR